MSSVADNDVAERSSESSNEKVEIAIPPAVTDPITNHDSIFENPKPAQTLLLTSGHVTGSTLLHSMSVNRVTVKLKGVTSDKEIISLPETTRLKGCYLDSAVYMSYDGTVDVLVANTLNENIILKPGTQIGSFQICEQPIKIVNETEGDTDKEKSIVFSVQSDNEDLEWKFRDHLKSPCQHNLQNELLNLLVKHKDAIALPGDALGKTDVLKHKIKLKKGTQPIYIPAYRMPHSARHT